MFDDFRMWRLVRYLSKKGIKYEAEARAINKVFNQNIAHNLELEYFLENRADAHWFYIYKLLPQRWKEIQIQKDNRLMQIAHGLNYIEIAKIKKPLGNQEVVVIHYLPDGYKFSSPSAFLVFFAEKYKIIWAILIAVIGYSPIFKPLAISLYNATIGQ